VGPSDLAAQALEAALRPLTISLAHSWALACTCLLCGAYGWVRKRLLVSVRCATPSFGKIGLLEGTCSGTASSRMELEEHERVSHCGESE
jgi:hypothetical protein